MMVSLFFIVLIPLAMAGLALIHQGLGRSRSAAQTMLSTLCAIGIGAIVFVLIGSAWAGVSGSPGHAFQLSSVRWDWLGADRFFAQGLHTGDTGAMHGLLAMCLQMFAVGIAAMIPISTGSDRWRLGAVCAASAAMAAILYPLFSHWVWGGGWLARFAGFVDVGGAGVVQVVGGLAALSVAWVLGPRRGKYADGLATAIPGHNIVQVLFGCLLCLVGWIGLECSAAILVYGASSEQMVMVVLNAMLAASAGLLAAVSMTRVRYRKPDSSISANGWVAGLVAGSAGCCFLTPGAAIFLGLVAGALTTWLVEFLEMKALVDDPGGAVAVHAGAGIWGLIAYGALSASGTDRWVHLLAELVGVATLVGLMFPLIHGMNLLLNRLVPYRVDRDGDWQGMDIRELGAGAYPEFVIHTDEFVPR
jgi:Amt family ammonium transporter